MKLLPYTATLLLVFLLPGCGSQDELTVYEVPKQAPESSTTSPAEAVSEAQSAPSGTVPPPGSSTMQVLPGMAETSSAFPLPSFEKPAAWRELPANPPRRAAFDASGSELVLTVFPGDVGGVAANARRWAGQVGVSVEGEPVPAKVIVLSDGTDVPVFEYQGNTPAGPIFVRGAIISRPTHTWFLKLTASQTDPSVAAQMDTFLESFRFAPSS